MSNSELTIERLLQDESFISFCTRSNEKDIRYWERYIADNPGKKAIIEEAVQEYRLLFTVLAGNDLDEQLEKLKQKVEAAEKAPVVSLKQVPVKGTKIVRYQYVVAAAIAALLIMVAGYYMWNQQKAVIKTTTELYASNQGERKSFQLPDGTQVSLNAGSSITLNGQYGQTTREVYLKGEAFFEVQHNRLVPFIVHTADMDVKALGTAFNVKSYNSEKKTETVLIRGLVEVTLKHDNNRKVLLHPDEKIAWVDGVQEEMKEPVVSLPEKDEKAVVKPVKKMIDGSIKELAWVENNLAFDDESFEEIALQLSRWYAVEIKFESEEVKQYHFTGTFKKEKIDRVLDILKSSRLFKYQYDGQQSIIIYK